MARFGKIDKEIARLRDVILMKCIERDVDAANDLVVNLEKIINNMDDNEFATRESICRLWETKLDVAEISECAPLRLIAIMEVINKLPEFTENRRAEILERGFRMLRQVLK